MSINPEARSLARVALPSEIREMVMASRQREAACEWSDRRRAGPSGAAEAASGARDADAEAAEAASAAEASRAS